MADLKYQAMRHKHAEFLAQAKQRTGFAEAYDALAREYARASRRLKGCGKTQINQVPRKKA